MNKQFFRGLYSEKRINSVLLALYLTFVLLCQVLVWGIFNTDYYGFALRLCLVVSLLLSPLIIRFVSPIYINDSPFERITGKKLTLFFYLTPLVVFLFFYLIYFPGSFSPDTYNQYAQITSGRYNDWHPVLHTLFAFFIPLKATNGWVGSISLFQIIVFAIALGYSFSSVYKYTGKKYIVGFMIYTLCNPLICISIIPWKDVTFAIGALLLMTFSLNTIETKGLWIKKPLNFIVFSIIFVCTTIIRHNAVLFTAPLLVALFFQIPWKRFLVLTLSGIVLFVAIKGPLYSYLDVEKPDHRQVETLGLPMTIIGAAVTGQPDQLDEDVLEFAYNLAPKNVWEQNYVLGNFNSIKSLCDLEVIEQYGTKRILEMTMRCIKSQPEICIKSLIKTTEAVYTVTDPHYVGVEPAIGDNSYGIEMKKRGANFRLLFTAYRYFITIVAPHLFLFYGVVALVVMVSILAKCNLGVFHDWKKIFFAVPLFSYNFGSALLLTGYDDSPRFFYYTVLIVPVILVLFYKMEESAK